ncbi:MAG: hypothetical protein PHC61_01400 [Chitinivibrionales bacterium]|nr:hypothetical protein [Chitinivibrionales bacterium]
MKIDILQWLKDTGGKNADSRFKPSDTQTPNENQSTSKISFNTNQVNALKADQKYNYASQLLGFNKISDTVDIISNLAARPLKAVPQQPQNQSVNTNRVDFNQAGNGTNKATVTGNYNVVDFTSNSKLSSKNNVTVNGSQNTIRAYNGGQTNNSVQVTGNTNKMLIGNNASNNTLAISGASNSITLGEQASQNQVSIKGNNVSVSMGGEGLASGGNQQWKIDVNGSDVNVSIVNGKASVNVGAGKESQYKIAVNDLNKTISVSMIAAA